MGMMNREETLDWLYRLRSNIYVYMPKEWLIPMNNALDVAIKALEQEPCKIIKEIPKDYKYDTETEDFLVYRHMYTGHEIHIEKPVPRYRLEQEPTTKNNLGVDAVSRKAVINQIFYSTDNNGDVVLGSALRERIARLPSVTPIRPKGHWIEPRNDDGMSDPIYYQVRCSECGFDLDPQTWHVELHQYNADKYCPNCGARMVEPQESEVDNGNVD